MASEIEPEKPLRVHVPGRLDSSPPPGLYKLEGREEEECVVRESTYDSSDKGSGGTSDPERLWTSKIERLVFAWGQKAVAYRQMHEMASTRAMFFYNLLGIPTIVLSATAGTLAFSGRKFPNVNMDMCVGAASMLVSALSGIQNFLHFSQKSEQHKQMVHKFAAFYHTVDAELTKHRKHRMNPFDFLQVLRLDLDRLVSDGPTIPPSIRKKHEKTLEVRRCRRNSDETEIIISVNKEEERMAVV